MSSCESNPDKAMSGVHPVLIHAEEDVDVFHGVVNSNDVQGAVGGITKSGAIKENENFHHKISKVRQLKAVIYF